MGNGLVSALSKLPEYTVNPLDKSQLAAKRPRVLSTMDGSSLMTLI